jgi:hypothetical protein
MLYQVYSWLQIHKGSGSFFVNRETCSACMFQLDLYALYDGSQGIPKKKDAFFSL